MPFVKPGWLGALEGRGIIARGEWSEPLGKEPGRKRALEGRQSVFFRPSRALTFSNPHQGFVPLTPGYYLNAPSGLNNQVVDNAKS